jgi:beta-lactamase superfamily II metal-dependent hydrolase
MTRRAKSKVSGIRIRMYRVGFGDCFLFSIPVNTRREHILIDCGAHYVDLHTIPQAVEDIAKETGKRLALVIATHNHRDHVSGFAACEKQFSEFQVDQVWLPWTEDPENDQARRLRTKQQTLAARLALSLHAAGVRPELAAMLDNFPAWSGQDQVERIRNRRAMQVLTQSFRGPDGRTGSAVVRYLAVDEPSEHSLTLPPTLPDLRATLLAPSRSKAFVSMLDPPKDHHYFAPMGGDTVPLQPFEEEWKVLPARYIRESLWPPNAKSALAKAVPDDLAAVARWLEDAINNTSLVLHFRALGRNFLFAGDAQWGSWLSWLYQEGDTARGLAAASRDLLRELDFLKVSHHGSVNGTPSEVVANLSAKAAVMCSTNKTASYPQVPLSALIDALDTRTGRLALSDQVVVEGNPRAQEDLRRRPLPPCFTRGPFWVDYTF